MENEKELEINQPTEAEKLKLQKEAKKANRATRKHPILSFIVVTLILMLAFLSLMYLDQNNSFRKMFFSWLDIGIFRDIFTNVTGGAHLDIYMVVWLIFFVVAIAVYTIASGIILRRPIIKKRRSKRYLMGKPTDEKWVKSFNGKYAVTCVAIAIVMVGLVIGVFYLATPKHINFWENMATQLTKTDMQVWLNLLKSLACLLIFILAVPAAIGIIVLILSLLIRLVAMIGTGVGKAMMSSKDYQDFKAAAEAAAASRRKDAGLDTKESVQQQQPAPVEPVAQSAPVSGGVGGQVVFASRDPSNNELCDLRVGLDSPTLGYFEKISSDSRESRADVIFPALSAIDAKWEQIEADKAAAEKAAEEEKAHLAEIEALKKTYEKQCRDARAANQPAPEKPEALIKEEERLAEEAAAKKDAVKKEEERHVIGTAVQNEVSAAERERFEELKEAHKKMTYKEFKTLALRFQSYLAFRKYYYPLNTIRAWIAAFSSSRLVILQGLSGTGKTTLPRLFLDFVGGKAHFFPVQSTWRDRSDIVGYFSDFAGQFKETELLKHLYEASYTPDNMNMLVLDEMNISRIEYYFADFLSIFEYPASNWLVPLIQPREGENLPKKLEGGAVRIPVNTWFVGTANTDDSTFTITDKVYDRAIVIEFNELNAPFTTDVDHDPYPVSMGELSSCITEAIWKKENALTQDERRKFLDLADFISETFDIAFGNRIMNQIDRFVPVFVALGGTKNDAIDVILARKILRKLDGHFESYVRDGLVKLKRYLNQNYGKEALPLSEALVDKYQRKLS